MSSSLAGLMVFAAFIFGILLGKDIEDDKREARREELSEKVRAKLRNRKAALKQMNHSVTRNNAILTELRYKLGNYAVQLTQTERRALRAEAELAAFKRLPKDGSGTGGVQATGGAGGHPNA